MNTKTCGCTPKTCGCCDGIQMLTPQDTANRPGLSALNYRVGTHAAFLETMKARLTTMKVDVLAADGQTVETLAPLSGLTTRDSDDFSIALLDGWATVADVLTFYQERIANEGYLRTATERRSILELARLTGYALRPGVAATVYLAYTIDEDHSVTPPIPVTTTIPQDSRSQSVPGPGELPQSFETSEEIEARSAWNALHPRMTQPQTKTSIQTSGLYLSGIATNLKVNDPLLIDFGETGQAPVPFRVQQIITDAANNRTQVILQSWNVSRSLVKKAAFINANKGFDAILKSLDAPASVPPVNALQLPQNTTTVFAEKTDVFPRLLTTFGPRLRRTLYPALQNAVVTAPQPVKVYALRVKAGLFGNNALKEPQYEPATIPSGEFEAPNPNAGNLKPQATWPEWSLAGDETTDRLFLESTFDHILPGSFVAVLTPNLDEPKVFAGIDVRSQSRNAYGISAKTTLITLPEGNAWRPTTPRPNDLGYLRATTVYTQSEELDLAEAPIVTSIGAAEIELDTLLDGLEAGRWLIISGERDDAELAGTSGVRAAELLMLQGADNRFNDKLPGDKTHTFLRLATPMAYSYKRDTVTIYGNVVKATHGERRNETLGNGDGSQSLQTFALKQPPLTFVPAPNRSGVESTLEVFVNDVQWHEVDAINGLGPKDRNFITRTDNDGKTTLIFGDGVQGARLPTGQANVRAAYRNGIGQPGNVKAEQISLLQTRPLNVKSVINPLPASGGADKENRDQARENAPLAVMSLDRLVSLQDYADFTRTFAGIGKAVARKLSDSKRQLVHVTIAGAEDALIDATSDLYQNLLLALRKYGDLDLPVSVQLRELVALVLSANVRLAADYQWEPVATAIRVAVLDSFGFQKRALGQPVLLSEVISVIQNIAGVEYVDMDTFGGVPEKKPELDENGNPTGKRILLTLDDIAEAVKQIINPREALDLRQKRKPAALGPASGVDVNLADFDSGALRPAQLAIFTDAVPDMLILNQIK